jgi:hypothetical protein
MQVWGLYKSSTFQLCHFSPEDRVGIFIETFVLTYETTWRQTQGSSNKIIFLFLHIHALTSLLFRYGSVLLILSFIETSCFVLPSSLCRRSYLEVLIEFILYRFLMRLCRDIYIYIYIYIYTHTYM